MFYVMPLGYWDVQYRNYFLITPAKLDFLSVLSVALDYVCVLTLPLL